MTLSKIYPVLCENKVKFIDKRNFLICESCLWCATCLTDLNIPNNCPLCGNNEIESMSVSAGESYRLVYNDIRGMVLEFWLDSNDGDLVN